MIRSSTQIHTPKAVSYLLLLLNHFNSQSAVESFADSRLRINFDCGSGEVIALNNLLKLVVKAEKEENLERAEMLLGSHVERFAFREKLAVDWTRS